MAARKMAPIHPGEILQVDFLEPLGVSQYRLARDISVPARRINEIVHGKRAVSADTALRPRCEGGAVTPAHVCLTLVVGRELRQELFDYLSEQTDLVPGFTAS